MIDNDVNADAGREEASGADDVMIVGQQGANRSGCPIYVYFVCIRLFLFLKSPTAVREGIT
jgi:hypothetical protein